MWGATVTRTAGQPPLESVVGMPVSVDRLEDLLMLRLSRCLNCRPTVLQRRCRAPVQFFGKPPPSRTSTSRRSGQKVGEVNQSTEVRLVTNDFTGNVEGASVKLNDPFQIQSSFLHSSTLKNEELSDKIESLDSDPLTCRSRLDASMQVFRRKLWKPFQLKAPSAGAGVNSSSNGVAGRFYTGDVAHTCRRQRPTSSYAARSATSGSENTSTTPADQRRPLLRRPQSVPSHLLRSRVTEDTNQLKDNESQQFEDSVFNPDVTELSPILSSKMHDWRSDKQSDSVQESGKAVMEVNISDDDDSVYGGSSSDDVGKSRKRRPAGANPQKLNLRADIETENWSFKELTNFEFDANIATDEPEYLFPSPLPEFFRRTNFRSLVECGNNWRQTRGLRCEWDVDPEDRDLLDRIMELERQQIETEQVENSRQEQLRRAAQERKEQLQRWRANGQVQRIQSAKTRSQKSKNCCANCLQPACTGDCPLKSARPKICLLCRQPYCYGTCAKTAYEEHKRQEGVVVEEQVVPAAPARCRPCSSCQQKRSGTPTPPARRGRLRGRSALAPGKSRQSNRRDSLSIDPETGATVQQTSDKPSYNMRKPRPQSAF